VGCDSALLGKEPVGTTKYERYQRENGGPIPFCVHPNQCQKSVLLRNATQVIIATVNIQYHSAQTKLFCGQCVPNIFCCLSSQRLKDNPIEPPNLITSTPPEAALPKRERKRTRERTPAQTDKERDKERGHERKRKREQERNREEMMACVPPSRIALPAPLQGVNNPDFAHLLLNEPHITVAGAFIDGSDIFTVPDEYKKEGSDWYAVFNPKVKRVLDIRLVHKLMHERCISKFFLRKGGCLIVLQCRVLRQILVGWGVPGHWM